MLQERFNISLTFLNFLLHFYAQLHRPHNTIQEQENKHLRLIFYGNIVA